LIKQYCDNSTCKIHISDNFILSISFLIMFDTLLLRPSLHCNTLLHFTTLHPTTFHYTYWHFTSSHLHFTTLSFSFTHLHFLSFYFTSHHTTRHSSDLIPKLISKIINPFTALKNFSPFHFASIFILFYLFAYLSYQPYTSTFYRLYFPSLVYTFLTLVLKIRVLPWEVPVAFSGSLFQSVMVLFTNKYFPISVLCFLALIFQ
jgi:hypothetical protein